MKIYVLMDNQPRGPYSPEFVRQMLARGRVFSTHLGAYDGSTEWKPLSEFMREWGVAPPKRSKSGRFVAMIVTGLILLAAGGGLFWWHVHHGAGGNIVASTKTVAAAKVETALPSTTHLVGALTPVPAVPASPAQTASEISEPTREMLAGKQFRFSWKTEKRGGNYRPLMFHADGTLEGGTGSPNETFWAIDGQGRLVFKHRDGRVSTIFTSAERRDGKWFLSGPYQFSPGVEHSLAETDPDTTSESGTAPASASDPAARLMELKQLYDQGLIPQDIYEQKRQQIINSL